MAVHGRRRLGGTGIPGVQAPDPDSYYRAAHQLHDIAGQLDDERAYRAPVEPDALFKRLEELADWEPGGHENVNWDGWWRWREVVSGLRRRAERKRLHTAP